MGVVCGTHGRDENAFIISVRKPEGKRPLGRPRCRWEDIRKDLKRNRLGRCGLNSSGSV